MVPMDLAAVSRAVAAALRGPCGVTPGTPVAVACSGGADSVALVHALAAGSADFPLAAVLFVDHGLRDVTSDRASALAAALAAGVPFRAATLAPPGPGNLQANARAARYRALLSLAGAGVLVATGHTADDQTETLLGRMARGTGLPGLRGIRARHGRVVRPLLAVPRATTRGLGLPFFDDPSNDTPRFLRNRLRAAVIPALQTENPGIHEAFSALAEAAEGTLALLDALLPAVSPTVSSPPLVLHLPPLGPAALAALLRHLAGQLAPDTPPSRAALTAMAAALSDWPERPAGCSLGNGWSLAWDPDGAVGTGGTRSSGGATPGARPGDGALRFVPERDPRVSVVLHGPGRAVVQAHLLTLEAAASGSGGEGRATTQEAVRLSLADTRWPLRAATEDGALVVRDAAGVQVWPEVPAVSTCSGAGAVPVEEHVATLALRVAPVWPLTVVARGFLRVRSADSTPRPRSGRSS